MKSRRNTPPLDEVDLASLRGRRVAFWRQGNFPDQELRALSSQEIGLHLVALYLLADHVLASSSFYLESDKTRRVTRKLRGLFEQGKVLYFIDDTLESFEEHAHEKASKSPLGMLCYQNVETLSRRASDMALLGHLVRRPSDSISDRIVSLWVDDVASSRPGSLGYALQSHSVAKEQGFEWAGLLVAMSQNRTQDFVWEYVERVMAQASMPGWLLRIGRRRLADFYTQATAEVLGIKGMPAVEDEQAKVLDSGLFLECMRSMGVLGCLARLSVAELISLKASSEWAAFSVFYFTLVDSGLRLGSAFENALPFFVALEDQLPGKGKPNAGIEDDLGALRIAIAQWVDLNDRPVEILKRVYALFGHGPIRGLRSRLLAKASPLRSTLMNEAQSMITRRTVVEVDLVGYSSILSELENALDVSTVVSLNDQIHAFIDSALQAVEAPASCLAVGTGDGAILIFEQVVMAHRFAEALHATCKRHNSGRPDSAARVFRSGAATGDIAIVHEVGNSPKLAGSAIARAVRLESAANAGEFVIDDETFHASPSNIRKLFSGPTNVKGKRNEIFVAHRRTLDHDARRIGAGSVFTSARAAPVGATHHDRESKAGARSRRAIELSGRILREQVDVVMILLDMPFELRPPPMLNVVERMTRVIDWAATVGKIDELVNELEELSAAS